MVFRSVFRLVLVSAALGLVSLNFSLWAIGPPLVPPVGSDCQLLQSVGLRDKYDFLLFFERRTPSPTQQKSLEMLLQQLGNTEFDVREKATREFVAAGPCALPFLRRGLQASDRETVKRSKRCLQALAQHICQGLPEAVARVLAEQHPEGSEGVLLAYLPFTEDDEETTVICRALVKIHKSRSKPDPALLRALVDPNAIRRAAAAQALGAGSTFPKEELEKLSKDSSIEVRFRAVQARVQQGDLAAVSELLPFLFDAPLPIAWQAERMLRRIGERTSPSYVLQGTGSSRRECHLAWLNWWKSHHMRLTLRDKQLKDGGTETIIYTELDAGNVVAMDWDRRVLWEVKDLEGPVCVHALLSGRLLIAENHGGRVTERDLQGRVVWEWKSSSFPICCWRLDSGNTLLVVRNAIVEVSPEGRTIASRSWPDPILYAARVRGNQIVLLDAAGQFVHLSSKCIERGRLDLENLIGSEESAAVLPGGVFLFSSTGLVGIRALKDDGTMLSRFISPGNCAGLTQDSRGVLLLCNVSEHTLDVLDWSHQVIFQHKTRGRPWHIQIVP